MPIYLDSNHDSLMHFNSNPSVGTIRVYCYNWRLFGMARFAIIGTCLDNTNKKKGKPLMATS